MGYQKELQFFDKWPNNPWPFGGCQVEAAPSQDSSPAAGIHSHHLPDSDSASREVPFLDYKQAVSLKLSFPIRQITMQMDPAAYFIMNYDYLNSSFHLFFFIAK